MFLRWCTWCYVQCPTWAFVCYFYVYIYTSIVHRAWYMYMCLYIYEYVYERALTPVVCRVFSFQRRCTFIQGTCRVRGSPPSQVAKKGSDVCSSTHYGLTLDV